MTKRRTATVALSIGLIALFGAAYYYLDQHRAPLSQRPLVDLTAQNMETFRIRFNEAKDRIRIILLLSPT